MRMTAGPPFIGLLTSVWLPRPSTPSKRKFVGRFGISWLHSNRRNEAGAPDNVRIVALRPLISTSAVLSTTTSMVHLPSPPPPPPLIEADMRDVDRCAHMG